MNQPSLTIAIILSIACVSECSVPKNFHHGLSQINVNNKQEQLLALIPEEEVLPELHSAAYNGDLEAVCILLASQAVSINAPLLSDGSTALHLAIEAGHKAIVDILLGVGADVFAVDHEGYNALDLVIECEATAHTPSDRANYIAIAILIQNKMQAT
ncbi:ankyrin repeat domain-containing protein [Candidatus Dependentiae bacterium]|nr:ankyrin repeat domain-containing protein [Candidatus Dependentiae bacterium]